jgi:nucleoside-diphosphate-sugar epimerase
MKILITGICGFVGSSLAKFWRETSPDWDICGLDNFIRPGSERNRLLDEIARQAEAEPDWLDLSAP